MIKCDQVKDLLLTEYLDGELDKSSAALLEGHLHGCSDCAAYLKEIKNSAALPFQQATRQTVPAELWDMIQQRIEDENQAKGMHLGIVDQLKGMFIFPRMIPVFASLMLMILVGSVTLNTIQVQKAKDREQGEYLVSLLSPTVSTDTNESGTPIEHYFL